MLPASQASMNNVEKAVGTLKRKCSSRIDDDDEGDDCEDCETDDDVDDEETEEDRAFINDGKVEKLAVDLAGVDPKNIIESDGGRPKRQRKAPIRWEHPDAASVMRKFCDKWNVTDEDINEIFNEDDETEKEDDSSSFHSEDDTEEETGETEEESEETEETEEEETEELEETEDDEETDATDSDN